MHFRSIASRIILTVIPVVAVFTVIYVVAMYSTMSKQIDAQFDERMSEGLDSAKLSITNELTKNIDVAKSTAIYAENCDINSAGDGEMKEFLIDAIPSNENTVGGGIWYEPYEFYSDEEYYGPFVYTANDEIHFAGKYEDEVDYHNTEWYLNGKNSNGEAVWSDVYYDPVADVVMVTVSIPFYKSNGDFWGVTTADMAMTNIQKISSDISIGDTGEAFILGANGEFISFMDESRDFEDTIIEDEDSNLKNLGTEMMTANTGSATLEWGGETKDVFYTTIEETQWHLAVMVDDAELGKTTNELVFSMALIPVIGLIIVALCIIYLARYLRRVVGKVNELANNGASGNLNERISISEYDEFGEMEHNLNIMMDNMLEMNKRNEDSLKMAEDANKAKTEFLSKMTHEMRTPMNAIIGMVQISEKTDDKKKIRECIEKIEVASRSLLSLINDILDMSKIEANKMDIETIKFSIKEVVDEVLSIHQIKANEKNIELVTDIAEDVPHNIWSDRFRYSQIIINLLSNAIKFTPEGGRIEIRVSASNLEENRAIIKTGICDNGIGVIEEASGKLFNSFEQADSSTSRKFGGSGLGLTISKNLAELMGGQIYYEPNPGGGSRFIFTIGAFTSGVEPDDVPVDYVEKDYDFSGRNILCAEDIEVNKEIVKTLLEDTGIEMIFAENGVECVNLFKENANKLDLILMDIRMPEMDGLEATKAIRSLENGKDIPIIAMSANAFEKDIELSNEAGMNGYIPKPFNLEDLLSKLDAFFSE